MTGWSIAGERVLVGGHLRPARVEIEGAVIARVGEWHGEPVDVVVDEGLLAPGLIDLQVNGCAGHDVATCGSAGRRAMSAYLPTTGVTAFVPTVVSSPLGAYAPVVARWADAWPMGAGAAALGLHFEGPFLSPDHRGTHPADHVIGIGIDLDAVREWAVIDGLAYVTLAPELAGAPEAVALLRSGGRRVAIGHSGGTAADVEAAVAAGATLVTHVFNALPPMRNRAPGFVDFALTCPSLYLGLIADGVHVSGTFVRLAFAAAAGRVCLVTDSMSAAGAGDGTYRLGEDLVVTVADGIARNPQGDLAGSVARLDGCVGVAVASGVPVVEALAAASATPAAFLGDATRGTLAEGRRADLVWLDGDLSARRTWVGGRLAFS